jgi:hypothetical protein
MNISNFLFFKIDENEKKMNTSVIVPRLNTSLANKTPKGTLENNRII